MASILRTTSLLIEENKEYEEIPEEAGLNFNFLKDDEGVPKTLEESLLDKTNDFKITKEIIEQASQSAYDELLQINKEEQEEEKLKVDVQSIEQIVDAQAEQVEQKAEKIKRERRPSKVILEIEQEKLENQALKEAKERLNLKKRKEIPIPQDLNSTNLSEISNLDDGSEDTSANKIIIDNIRLETYNATSQAIAIYGGELTKFITPDSPCALCGFPLKDRISYIHNETHGYKGNPLTWSYDHFVPVNFSAVVFRIVTSKNYEKDELNLLKDNGYIVCYHCNYEKSQRLFVTCPKKDGVVDFNNFQPNEETITKFVNDLYVSRNKHGWADKKGNRTLINCLIKYSKHRITWIRERIKAIKELAQKVCNNIISKVDFEAVEERLKLTKLIVRKAQTSVIHDERYKGLNPKSKNRFRREYIAKLFAAAELTFRSPWKWKQTKPSSNDPHYMASTISRQLKETKGPKQYYLKKTKSPGKSIKRTQFAVKGGSLRKHTRKSRRKTYRRIRLF